MLLPPLPSSEDLIREFGLFCSDSYQACAPEVDAYGRLSCLCPGCRRWKQYLKGTLTGFCTWPQYEVLTQELISGLATHIRSRCEAYRLAAAVVLELGGGDGRLSGYLSAQLGQEPVSVICTDSGVKKLHAASPLRDQVILLPAEEALKRFQPHIVLVSWMPLGVDFTASVRATASVLEYILIGEADGGICGDPWLTWGIAESDDSSEDDMLKEALLTPFEEDGFLRKDIADLVAPQSDQICCTDERWLRRQQSRTVAFLRDC